MGFHSLNYFIGEFMTQILELNRNDWVVTSLGSGCDDNDRYWSIAIKNIKTREEKRIEIPCYKD